MSDDVLIFTPTLSGSSDIGAGDFSGNIDNGPSPGTGNGGYAGNPSSAIIDNGPSPGTGFGGYAENPGPQEAGGYDYAGMMDLVNGSGNSVAQEMLKGDLEKDLAAQVRETYSKSLNGDESATDWLKQLAGKIGDRGVAALIQGGFGMLAGYSQGKMLEKKWEREKEMRDQEWARKDAHSKPGSVGMLNWSPNAPKGLLGAPKV